MAIFTAIGTAIAGVLFAGAAASTIAFAGAVIAAGLAVGAQLAISYLFRPKKRAYSAIQSTLQIGADVPVDAVFGTSKLFGTLRYYGKYGSGNKFNAYVHALSIGPCDGLEPYVYFYGQKHALIAQTPQHNETERWHVDGFGDKIVIRFYDGSANQGPDVELVADTSDLDNSWKSTSIGEGRAYVVSQRTYDADLFEDGIPEIEWVLRGLKQYDPRKDDTVSGGSGSHRFGDLTTYEHTENPAIHRLTYSTGLRGLLSNSVLLGVGHDINQMQIPLHMAAANVCDTERTVNSRTFKKYQAALYATANDDHIEVLAEFEDAMAGYAVNRSGYSGVIAGAAQVPVLEITNKDIRDDAPIGVKNRNRADESVNYLTGFYTSIEKNWKSEALKAVSVLADVAKDKSEVQAENNFLQVTDPDVAQYLLNIRYRQNRKQAKRTLPVSRRIGAKVETGDWVTYEGKSWLVTRRSFDAAVRFTLDLAETGSDVYLEAGIDPGPVLLPPSVPTNPSLLQTVANFSIDVGFFTSENGAQIPTLVFTWSPPADPTIDQVVIEYQPKISGASYGPTQYAVSVDPESGRLEIDDGILSETFYRARATIRTTPDRLKSYTAWVSAVSDTSRNTDITVGLSQTRDDILGSFNDAFRRLDEMESRVDLLSGNVNINNSDEYLNRTVVAKKIGATAAAIVQEAEIRVSEDSALASLVDAVSAEVDDVSASGLFSIEAAAGDVSDDFLVRLSMLARATTGDVFSEAGIIIEVYEDGPEVKSRILMTADQMAFYNPSDGDVFYPVEIVDGVLKAKDLEVGGANITNLIVDGTATIADAVIGTSNLDANAVTYETSVDVDETDISNTSYTTIDTFSVPVEDANTIDIYVNISFIMTLAAFSDLSGGLRVRRQSTGDIVLIAEESYSHDANSVFNITINRSDFNFFTGTVADTTENFDVQVAVANKNSVDRLDIQAKVFCRYLKK